MHAKPDLHVFWKQMITGSGSVNAAVIGQWLKLRRRQLRANVW